jgi:tetratricopeptide (TPR) repeat protein
LGTLRSGGQNAVLVSPQSSRGEADDRRDQPASTDVHALAEEAAALVYRDRGSARSLAAQAVGVAGRDLSSAATGYRVLAAVAVQEGHLDAAEDAIGRAIDAASKCADTRVLGEVLMTRMGIHVLAGRPNEALEDAQRAERYLPTELLPRLRGQAATVMATALGRIDDAIAIYDDIVEQFVRIGSKQDEAVVRNNRGLYLLYRGDVEKSWVDLALARDLFAELGNREAAAECGWNLLMAAARSGDLPLVFSLVDDLESIGDPHDSRAALDLAHTLLEANLIEEAVVAATAATRFTEDSHAPWAAEARLRLAEALLRAGSSSHAAEQALLAEQAATEEGHVAWAALARITTCLARQSLNDGRLPYEELGNAVHTLEVWGWQDEAADARLALAALALERGDAPEALHLARPLAEPSGIQLPGRSRERALHALAITRDAGGDRSGALRAAGAAIRALAVATRNIGSRELRVAAARRRASLTTLAMRISWDNARPRQTLAWAERLRANDLLRIGDTSQQQGIEPYLADLRALEVSNADDATKRFVRHHLERQIASRTRRAAGRAPVARAAFRAAEVLEALNDSALVEFLVVRGSYRAVTLHRNRVQRSRVDASVAETDSTIAALRRALTVLAASRSSASRRRSADEARLAAATMSRLLIEACNLPLCPLVVVPTAGLHGLPWNALPACQDRPLSIAPSASIWARCAQRLHPPRRVVAVVGPYVSHGRQEAQRVVDLYDQAQALVGADATSPRLLQAMTSADLVHIACHGAFRSDNPLFSSMQLADGPLMVHDLEQLERLPGHVVLSACDLALNAVVPGDEMLGLTAALYPKGVHTIIAASQPVDDRAACELMIRYHERLSSGARPAEALADAAAAARGEGDPSCIEAASVFGCHGAG